MAPATLAEVGWSDARCWCGRVPERVSLTTSAPTAEGPADLVLMGRCADHADPASEPEAAVAMLGPSAPGAPPAVQWRDLHTALLVLGTAAASLGEPLVMTDAEGRCLFSNGAWSAMTGLNSTRSRGLGWTVALGSRDRERLRRQLSSSRPELSVRIQLRSPGRRGYRPPVQMTAQPITDFDAAVVGHLLSFTAQPVARQPRVRPRRGRGVRHHHPPP